MKKQYLMPEMLVFKKETTTLLASSVTSVSAFETEYDGEQFAPDLDMDILQMQ